MGESKTIELPLKDGQEFVDQRGRHQKVCGSVVVTPGVSTLSAGDKDFDHTVCWTRRGDWFRRADAEPMTRAAGDIITVREFYRRRREGEL
jgi:hypothetical protein